MNNRFAYLFLGLSTSTAFLHSKGYASRNTLLSASKLSDTYSIPDQPKRFANAKAAGNKRMLDIDSLYNGAYLK